MGDRWSVERVLAAAPDADAAVAGRRLAGPGPWVEVGSDGPVIWGRCRGSARQPYRVVVDTAAPRYQCSCPSRKFPCKHALGLLFRWAEERFPDDPERPAYARAVSGDGLAPPQKREGGLDKASAAAARAAERDLRVASGLAELDRWIIDAISGGLGQLAAAPQQFEQQAARMIDAQAPGVARWLRRLLTVPPGSADWAGRILADLALIRLLIQAFNRRDDLEAELLATVRTHLGFTVPKAEVLATAPVPDHWVVIGLHDTEDDERISTRRVWLHGRATGRFALVLLFSVNGMPYEMTMAPGMELDADLHFYPGRPALRALVGTRRGEYERVRDLRSTGLSVTEVRDSWAAAIAADPWLTLWPIALRGRLTVADGPGRPDGHSASQRGVDFHVLDPAGAALPVVGPEPVLWQGMAISGGAQFTWFGELSPQGFGPLSGVDRDHSRGELVVL